MSKSEAVRFIDAVEADEVLARQVEALQESPEQVLDLVRASGFDVGAEEVREAFLERYGSELTEEQLAAIAGGLTTVEIVQITSSVVHVVGSLAIAAAW